MLQELFRAKCNLCGWPLPGFPPPVRDRCLRCLSTPIHRAVGVVINGLDLPPGSEVYELSSKGALVRYLRKRYRNLHLSEFFDDTRPGGYRKGVQCQDLQALTFADDSFDLITGTEVLEHVPDDRRGFCEMARVLRPGGVTVFTVPLRESANTLERARLEDNGGIIHMTEPEYHFDRLRGAGKVLAFRTYGLDICDRLKDAGLDATIRTVSEPGFGIVAQPVIIAEKIYK